MGSLPKSVRRSAAVAFQASTSQRYPVTMPCRISCTLSVDASVARTAIMLVRPYGRVVLMGGVRMLGGNDLALPYPWIMRNLITIKGTVDVFTDGGLGNGRPGQERIGRS